VNPSIRVLYVEDNPQDADLTRSLFAGHAPEFEIEIVGTGRECLERLRETGFDLLLLDHHLPDMDGLDVMKALSDADSQVPVVLVTGVGDEELVVKALRLGAANYVAKHGGYLETLLNQVRGVVEEHRQSRSQRIPIAASRRRILYVEHLPMDIELTLRHIAEASPHFAVDVVRTCAEALTRLEQPHAYDLALVDLRMPDLSGLDFVREAKQRRLPLPPFIMISGQGDEGAAIAALKLGARDYITKRDGYLNQLPHAIEQAIAHDRLDRINAELRVELAERKRVEHQLNERVKELRAHTSLGEMSERQDIPLDELYQELTDILPKSWQYEDIACARIVMGDREFRTENFAESTWKQFAPVKVNGVAGGRVEVAYLEERPAEDEGPFLKEERQLVDGIAASLGRVIERKRFEEALRESQELFTLYLRHSPICTFIKAVTPTESRVLYASDSLQQLTGISALDMVGKTMADLFPAEFAAKMTADDWAVVSTGEVLTLDEDLHGRNYTTIKFPIAQGHRTLLAGYTTDITERKQAEGALRVKNWAIESAINGMAMSDLAGSLSYVNPAFVRQWGYGSPAEILGRSVVEFWQMGDKASEVAAAVRAEGGWSGDLVAKRKDGVVFDVHVSSSLVLDATGQPICMQASFEDITERKQAQEALRLSLEGTLSVLGHAAEMRDPYTAGHQRRVTALAVAIARELGCSDDDYNALRIAGLLHDIGKLGIPAEILSKPSQLSAIEFKLVREHSQTGYDILADVPFPGPVAEIVFQHHERLDGSGYPRGLAGEQILREARILAVADVVEAMASHRPYRAALGIDAALTEIRAGSGTRYDQQIADACVALFESGEFSFQPAPGG